MRFVSILLSLAVLLSLGTSCDLLTITESLEHNESGDLQFDLGTIDASCDDGDDSDGVTSTLVEADGETACDPAMSTCYCKVETNWNGTVIDMSEVHDGIRENAGVEPDAVDVEFTDMEIRNINITLQKDGSDLLGTLSSTIVSYRAWSTIDGVGDASLPAEERGYISAEWEASSGSTANSPDVVFFEGDGTKDDLLAHLNAQYVSELGGDGAGDVTGTGDSIILFEFDSTTLSEASGATLTISYDLVTSGTGTGGVNSIGGLIASGGS